MPEKLRKTAAASCQNHEGRVFEQEVGENSMGGLKTRYGRIARTLADRDNNLIS